MGAGSRSGRVEVTGLDALPVEVQQDDVEQEVLCDLQADFSIVEFLRRYLWDETGTLIGFADFELDGSTVYVPTGTVQDCSVAASEASDCQSGFGGPPVLTALNSSGDTHTTDADARRVTINYQANSASGANRPTISVNGGAATILGKNGDQSQVIFGTLDTCNTLGYTLTIEVNQNNQDIDIIEEF